MEHLYPLFLNLKNQRVTIIGGGEIAARKLNGLIDTGAYVTVISPTLTNSILRYVECGVVKWIQRTFQPGDIEGAFYIISATNDPNVSEEIKKHIQPDQMINYADDYSSSNVIVPSVIRRGGLVIAVTTSGASPSLAKKVKKELEELYGQEYEEYVDFLMEKRKFLQNQIEDMTIRRNLLALLVEDPVFRTKEREERFQKIYKKLKDN